MEGLVIEAAAAQGGPLAQRRSRLQGVANQRRPALASLGGPGAEGRAHADSLRRAPPESICATRDLDLGGGGERRGAKPEPGTWGPGGPRRAVARTRWPVREAAPRASHLIGVAPDTPVPLHTLAQPWGRSVRPAPGDPGQRVPAGPQDLPG